jgi:hypothetical protein
MGRYWIRCGILVLFALGLCCCATLVAAYLILRPMTSAGIGPIGWQEVSTPFQQTFDVTGPVTLSADIPVGDVTVVTGTEDRVTVNAVKHAWAITHGAAQSSVNSIGIHIRQQGNEIAISTSGLDNPRNTPLSPRVDLTLTVPPQTALTLNAKVGQVRVTGTRGDLSIQGDIGQIAVTDVAPSQKLDIQTRVAGVEISGPLVQGAGYTITTDVGRILLSPPRDSTFSIDARSDVGNVEVGFPVIGQDSREGLVSKEVRGTVGSRPAAAGAAQVYLRSRVGDIAVEPK